MLPAPSFGRGFFAFLGDLGAFADFSWTSFTLAYILSGLRYFSLAPQALLLGIEWTFFLLCPKFQ